MIILLNYIGSQNVSAGSQGNREESSTLTLQDIEDVRLDIEEEREGGAEEGFDEQALGRRSTRRLKERVELQ